MGAYLALTCTYLVSNSTYYCKLSFNGVPTGEDHFDICLAGVWLHKERFLRTSSIVIKLLLLDLALFKTLQHIYILLLVNSLE